MFACNEDKVVTDDLDADGKLTDSARVDRNNVISREGMRAFGGELIQLHLQVRRGIP